MRNLKHLFVLGSCAAAAALAALTGCQSTQWGHKDERAQWQRANDNRITAQVRERLTDEPVYKFNSVDVKTFGGVVQLSGFVNSDQQKARAGQIAQQVAGVSRVENAITLKPNEPTTPTGRNQAPIVGFDQHDPAMSNTSTNTAPPAPAR